jgi:hypothetical protein
LSGAQLAYLQQAGILEGFHYALTHMAASGVYLHDAPAQLTADGDDAAQKKGTPLAPSASAPSLLPAIGNKTQHAVTGSPTTAHAVNKAKGVRTRDAYELLASHLDRFAVTWQPEERTSLLLAEMPSSSTAHPKRNPHVSREVPQLIAAQQELTAGQTEEKEDGAAASKVWSPEPKAQRKRDQKAYLASPTRVFTSSPTRDAHGRVANLYDGSDAVTSLDDAVKEPTPLHVLSPPKQKRNVATKPVKK